MADPKLENEAGAEQAIAMIRSEQLTCTERVARGFVHHPIKLFGAAYLVLVLMSLTTLQQGWFSIAETTSNDWTVPEAQESLDTDALSSARSMLDTESAQVTLGTRTKAVQTTQFQFIFEWTDPERSDEIITPRNLQEMCKVIRVLTGDAEYPLFCQPAGGAGANGKDTACAPQVNDITTPFYPSAEAREECKLLEQAQVDAVRNSPAFSRSGFFLPSGSEDGPIMSTRASLPLFGPLGPDSDPEGKGFDELVELPDGNDRQSNLYSEFLVDRIETNMAAYLGLSGSRFSSKYNTGGGVPIGEDGLQVRFYSFFLRQNEFGTLLQGDQLLLGGAVLFVGTVMMLHTRSLFLTVNGLVSILISIPVALFVYMGILGINYFSDIHIVVIFLVLGIGANDVFVFFDAYRQSETLWVTLRGVSTAAEALECNYYGSNSIDVEVLIARISYTLLRASGAVFNTSFTTFAAFMATGVSPVVPVAAFGYFAAIAILLNWVFVMVLYPSIAVVFNRYFEGRPLCCACFRSRRAGASPGLVTVASFKPDVENGGSSGTESETLGESIGAGSDDTDLIANEDQGASSAAETCEEKVFSRGYVPLMEAGVPVGKAYKLRPVPVVSILALLGLFVAMAIFTLRLETPTGQDEPFGSAHMFTGFTTDFKEAFGGGNNVLSVDVTFGIAGHDRGNFSRFDPNGYRGEVILDDAAKLTSRIAQEHILGVCDGLLEVSCIPEGEIEPLPGCRGSKTIVRDVECTLRDFHLWYNAANFSDVEVGPGENAALALGDADPALFAERMAQFVPLARRADPASRASFNVGLINNELRFLVITYEANLLVASPEQTKSPVFDLLYEYLDGVKADAPTEAATVFQTSFDMLWTKTEVGLVDGMFAGLAISLPIAYIVLLFATANLILSAYAIVAIVAIVSGVLGAAYLIGWSLGVGEAIASVMVIGLSVDFSTHTGSMYTHAGREGHDSRVERWRYSSLHMGPTVLAGAVTTAGSACVMFFCQLQFFTKMATLISLTMGLSVAYTFFFFLALCLLAGPQGHFGDWVYYLSKRCRSSS